MSASNSRVFLKLTLQRSRGTELHRFSGEYDFPTLCSAIAEVWGTLPKQLRITYVDEEGDDITVTTQREWEECLRLHHQAASTAGNGAALKLLVRRGTKSTRHAHKPHAAEELTRSDDDASCGSDDESKEARESSGSRHSSAVRPCRAIPVVPPLPIQGRSVGPRPAMSTEPTVAPSVIPSVEPSFVPEHAREPREWNFEPSPVPIVEPTCTPSAVQPQMRSSEARPAPPLVGDGAGVAALRLIGLLYRCDAVREITSPQSRAPFLGKIVNVSFNADTFEAHIDVNQVALRMETTVRSNKLLDERKYDEALDILRAAADVFPSDPVVLYNLACVHSLKFEPERAIEALRRAIAAGYNNPSHMEADEDLSLLRADPEFRSLAAMMRATDPVRGPSAAPVSVPPDPTAEPEVLPAVEVRVVEPAVPQPAEQPVIAPAVETNAPPTAPAPGSALRNAPSEVRQILAMFPMLDAEEAAQFLQRARNDVRRAVAIILGDV